MNQTQPNNALWIIRLFASLPWGLLYGVSSVLAFLARYVFRFRVAIARDNLSRCFPELTPRQINQLLGAYYRNLGQVVVEFIKIASLSAQQMREETSAGRSVILVAAHQCNWEWAFHGTVLQMEVPVDAAYKPLHSPKADQELRKLRVRSGANLIAAKRRVREVISRRRQVQVHAVAMLADQMPTSSQGRHWVNFLGRETAFYPGPAEIARMTGYAAFFVAMRRVRRGHYTLEIEPICAAQERLDPPLFTVRYAALIEAQIRASP